MRRNEASSSGTGRVESVVADVGRRRSSCGYCKSGRRSSVSHGLWAHSLTIVDYQELLDRGWRRSGCFLYKPEMEATCCPAYTIRLKADDFVPSKEQLRVSRRMQRFLDGAWDGKKQNLHVQSENLQGCGRGDELPGSSNMELETNEDEIKKEEPLDYLSEQIDLAIQSFLKSRDVSCDVQYPRGLVKKVSQTKKRRIVDGSEDLLYSSNASFQVAAVLRRVKPDGNHSRGTEKHSSAAHESSSDLSPKKIAEELTSALQHLVKTPELSIKACNEHINFYSVMKETPLEKKNQQVTFPSESSTKPERKGSYVVPEKPCIKKRNLEIILKRSSFDPEEFALYKKYQINVHNDEPDEVVESSYRRFLVDTPLIYVLPTGDQTVPPCGFGSFHQQYRIDGRLIAVGVIDILPQCLSSKYLFWDPDLAFLSLGKYSALQEISWVKENQRHCPSLQYYYLGYYIHSCPKMRYKAAYRPSELLCPLRYEWVPYDIAKPLLDRSQYAVLSDDINARHGEMSSTKECGRLLKELHNDLSDGGLSDTDVGGDEAMFDPDSGSSDDDDDDDDDDNEALNATEKGRVGDVLLGLRETRMRFKDLRRAISSFDQAKLEDQLSRFLKVVGEQLSQRMVYSLA